MQQNDEHDEGQAIEGLHAANVTAWFETNVEGVAPPLRFALIAGGHSNLTFSVTDSRDVVYVLRRPPLGHVLESAHDMGREHKIISALVDTEVPVAKTIGLCRDTDVNEAPFYVMAYVAGPVLHDAEVAGDGVTINSCQPGTHWTDRLKKMIPDKETAAQNIPAGVTGDPDDFGAAVAFLCSQQARFITGTGLLVDGGQATGLLD